MGSTSSLLLPAGTLLTIRPPVLASCHLPGREGANASGPLHHQERKPQDSRSARLPAPAPAEAWEAGPATQKMQCPQRRGWGEGGFSLKPPSVLCIRNLRPGPEAATFNTDPILIQDSRLPKHSHFFPRISTQDCKAGYGLAGKGELPVRSPSLL